MKLEEIFRLLEKQKFLRGGGMHGEQLLLAGRRRLEEQLRLGRCRVDGEEMLLLGRVILLNENEKVLLRVGSVPLVLGVALSRGSSGEMVLLRALRRHFRRLRRRGDGGDVRGQGKHGHTECEQTGKEAPIHGR